jgi:hypothetical protein
MCVGSLSDPIKGTSPIPESAPLIPSQPDEKLGKVGQVAQEVLEQEDKESSCCCICHWKVITGMSLISAGLLLPVAAIAALVMEVAIPFFVFVAAAIAFSVLNLAGLGLCLFFVLNFKEENHL